MIEELKKILKNLDLTISQDLEYQGFSIRWHTKANGKDCYWDFCSTTLEEFAQEVQQVYQDYGIEEQLDVYIEFRGQKGVPETASEIMKDLREERRMLKEIYLAVKKYLKVIGGGD